VATQFCACRWQEAAVLQYAWRHFDVSFERLLSGPGFELTYLALAELNKQSVKPLSAPDITRFALDPKTPCVFKHSKCFVKFWERPLAIWPSLWGPLAASTWRQHRAALG
jgi:glucokinase